MTETIEISTTLPTSAERIYRAWLASAEHAAFTGSAADIDPAVGGSFSAWDGYIQGFNLEMEPFHRIVQAWRTTDFPPGSPDSRLEIRLEPVSDTETRLTLLHSQIPEGQGQEYLQGWQDYYFTPMQAYFGS
jgi:uncharacterized protein YndB with AHSA1/START domain